MDKERPIIVMSWRTADGAYAGTNVTSINLGQPCLNPASAGYTTYSQPGGGRAGKCRFNDRTLIIEFDVPPDYVGTVNGGWWKIRYDFHTAPVTDRTTWQIRVEGDPVHLVDDGT